MEGEGPTNGRERDDTVVTDVMEKSLHIFHFNDVYEVVGTPGAARWDFILSNMVHNV